MRVRCTGNWKEKCQGIHQKGAEAAKSQQKCFRKHFLAEAHKSSIFSHFSLSSSQLLISVMASLSSSSFQSKTETCVNFCPSLPINSPNHKIKRHKKNSEASLKSGSSNHSKARPGGLKKISFFMIMYDEHLLLHLLLMPKMEKKSLGIVFLLLWLPFKSNIRSESATWINFISMQ